jgi:hypothetical protein
MYEFLECSQCLFSAYCRAEITNSAHSSTGLVKSIILDILVLGLDISEKKTTFSLKTQITTLVIHE